MEVVETVKAVVEVVVVAEVVARDVVVEGEHALPL